MTTKDDETIEKLAEQITVNCPCCGKLTIAVTTLSVRRSSSSVAFEGVFVAVCGYSAFGPIPGCGAIYTVSERQHVATRLTPLQRRELSRHRCAKQIKAAHDLIVSRMIG